MAATGQQQTFYSWGQSSELGPKADIPTINPDFGDPPPPKWRGRRVFAGKLRIDTVQKQLSGDEPLHAPESEIERIRGLRISIVGRTVWRDYQVWRLPERQRFRQRLRIKPIKDGA